MLHLIEERKVGWSGFNQSVCGLRFLYKLVNRRWLAVRFFNVVSFIYNPWCANANPIGSPTRLPQALDGRTRICEFGT
jgi:hypothetical protein